MEEDLINLDEDNPVVTSSTTSTMADLSTLVPDESVENTSTSTTTLPPDLLTGEDTTLESSSLTNFYSAFDHFVDARSTNNLGASSSTQDSHGHRRSDSYEDIMNPILNFSTNLDFNVQPLPSLDSFTSQGAFRDFLSDDENEGEVGNDGDDSTLNEVAVDRAIDIGGADANETEEDVSTVVENDVSTVENSEVPSIFIRSPSMPMSIASHVQSGEDSQNDSTLLVIQPQTAPSRSSITSVDQAEAVPYQASTSPSTSTRAQQDITTHTTDTDNKDLSRNVTIRKKKRSDAFSEDDAVQESGSARPLADIVRLDSGEWFSSKKHKSTKASGDETTNQDEITSDAPKSTAFTEQKKVPSETTKSITFAEPIKQKIQNTCAVEDSSGEEEVTRRPLPRVPSPLPRALSPLPRATSRRSSRRSSKRESQLLEKYPEEFDKPLDLSLTPIRPLSIRKTSSQATIGTSVPESKRISGEYEGFHTPLSNSEIPAPLNIRKSMSSRVLHSVHTDIPETIEESPVKNRSTMSGGVFHYSGSPSRDVRPSKNAWGVDDKKAVDDKNAVDDTQDATGYSQYDTSYLDSSDSNAGSPRRVKVVPPPRTVSKLPRSLAVGNNLQSGLKDVNTPSSAIARKPLSKVSETDPKSSIKKPLSTASEEDMVTPAPYRLSNSLENPVPRPLPKTPDKPRGNFHRRQNTKEINELLKAGDIKTMEQKKIKDMVDNLPAEKLPAVKQYLASTIKNTDREGRGRASIFKKLVAKLKSMMGNSKGQPQEAGHDNEMENPTRVHKDTSAEDDSHRVHFGQHSALSNETLAGVSMIGDPSLRIPDFHQPSYDAGVSHGVSMSQAGGSSIRTPFDVASLQSDPSSTLRKRNSFMDPNVMDTSLAAKGLLDAFPGSRPEVKTPEGNHTRWARHTGELGSTRLPRVPENYVSPEVGSDTDSVSTIRANRKGEQGQSADESSHVSLESSENNGVYEEEDDDSWRLEDYEDEDYEEEEKAVPTRLPIPKRGSSLAHNHANI